MINHKTGTNKVLFVKNFYSFIRNDNLCHQEYENLRILRGTLKQFLGLKLCHLDLLLGVLKVKISKEVFYTKCLF